LTEPTIDYFGQSLRFLDGPLRKMCLVMDRYIDFYQSKWKECETPFMYNERATLSQFVGGLWLSGEANFVLEEFGKDKGETDSKWKGRGDIWFSAEGKVCYGEAKQRWITPEIRGARIGELIELLKSECESAKRDSAQEVPDFVLGMLFVPITIKHRNAAFADENIETIRERFRERLPSLPYESTLMTYIRPNLLEECRYYTGMGKEGYMLTRPALYTLICGSPGQATAANT
jgi:hypothetical protein